MYCFGKCCEIVTDMREVLCSFWCFVSVVMRSNVVHIGFISGCSYLSKGDHYMALNEEGKVMSYF